MRQDTPPTTAPVKLAPENVEHPGPASSFPNISTLESGSMKNFCENDLIYYWDGVPLLDDLTNFVTPTTTTPVVQADPSCFQDLEDFLGMTELMPCKSSLEEEIFLDTLDDTELIDFLFNGGKSEPQESDLCPSPKKENVSDFQPTNNQDKAGSSCVPRFTANGNPLNHWSTFNRPELHTGAAPSTSATDNVASRKLDDTKGKPYTKKPLNAFMLYKAEQRQNVTDELQITNSAKVNVELGKRWKMMSEQEKKPYFDQAHREKKAHELKYPGWSYKDSYGKKPKRRTVLNKTLNHQAHSHNQNNQKPFQERPVETIIFNSIPIQAIPLEALVGDYRLVIPPISREGAIVQCEKD